MNKFVAAATASLFSIAAHAQSTPPGVPVPPNTPGYTSGKSEAAGEARKNAKAQGRVMPPAGDASKTAEGGAVGNDKAATAGQQRANTRDQRRPGRKPTRQGGTPD